MPNVCPTNLNGQSTQKSFTVPFAGTPWATKLPNPAHKPLHPMSVMSPSPGSRVQSSLYSSINDLINHDGTIKSIQGQTVKFVEELKCKLSMDNERRQFISSVMGPVFATSPALNSAKIFVQVS